MPSHQCRNSNCTAQLPSQGYCELHQPEQVSRDRDRDRFYNFYKRNKVNDTFYHSSRWRSARNSYIQKHVLCENCQVVVAQHVHHRIPLGQCTTEQEICPSNLQSLCIPCHLKIESQIPETEISTSIGTIDPREDENFYYDAEAAEKPIRFIEKFCRHWEGKWAGLPFILLEWEKIIIRKLFGYKHRDSHLRRFRELYLITAKGAGKTPLLAAIGLYMLIGDQEAAAHVISMASSFEQANLSFDAAKKFIAEDPTLRRHPGIKTKQYLIEAPKHSKWGTISGKPTGRSGPRPSCIIASEPHEWSAETVKAFDMLCANLFKRSQPLLLIDTNAGPDRQCFAYSLHERAVQVLDGKDDLTLLPVIFEAPKELDWRSEEAARAANPSIPEIVAFSQIKPEQTKGEARYRRLFLSQWVTLDSKWIDQVQWRASVRPFDVPADAPLYVSYDGSNGDDLCAMTEIYPTSKMYFVKSRFWLPRQTAERYEEKNLIKYSAWEAAGHITLLDSPTISDAIQEQIACEILELNKIKPIIAFCYDRAYSGRIVPILEQAQIVCMPIGQGWGVSHGCQELSRRLIEQSIVIEPNMVLDFCSNNVEVERDKHDNIWPIKPHQTPSNKSTGIRSRKIDGISALVTGLTQARKHDFPKPQEHIAAAILEL